MIPLLILITFIMEKTQGQEVIIPRGINVHFVTPATFYGEQPPIFFAPIAKPQLVGTSSEPRRSPGLREDYVVESARYYMPPSKQSVQIQTKNQKYSAHNGPVRVAEPTLKTDAHTSAKTNDKNNINMDKKPVFYMQTSPVPQTSLDKTRKILPPTMNITTAEPPTNQTYLQPVDKNGTKITLEDRSSFNGDQCPTGQIKINGKCVPKD